MSKKSSVDFTLKVPEICATSNMATTHLDHFAKKMLPENFRLGDDLEEFIEESERYFQYVEMPKAKQEIAIEYMLEKELRSLYRKVDVKVKGYKDRLRTAFLKKTSMIEDIRNAFEFRQTYEEPKIYFQRIDKLVAKIMGHKWTKESLTEQLLVHCSNERSLKREICLSGTTGIGGIKEKIEKLYESRTNEEINSIRERRPERSIQRPFKEVAVAKRPSAQREEIGYKHRRPENNRQEKRIIECWTCKERGHVNTQCHMKKVIECYGCGQQGHMKRECPVRKTIVCYSCGEQGHLRRDCSKIRCGRCKLGGHKETDCYTNMNGPRFRTRLMEEKQRVEGNEDRQHRETQEDTRMRRKNEGYVTYVNEESNDRRSSKEVPEKIERRRNDKLM